MGREILNLVDLDGPGSTGCHHWLGGFGFMIETRFVIETLFVIKAGFMVEGPGCDMGDDLRQPSMHSTHGKCRDLSQN